MDHPNESNEENEMFDIRFDDERVGVCVPAMHRMHCTLCIKHTIKAKMKCCCLEMCRFD